MNMIISEEVPSPIKKNADAENSSMESQRIVWIRLDCADFVGDAFAKYAQSPIQHMQHPPIESTTRVDDEQKKKRIHQHFNAS